MRACMFQGSDQNCCYDDKRNEILSDIGKCFVVQAIEANTGKNQKQTIPGPTGGALRTWWPTLSCGWV